MTEQERYEQTDLPFYKSKVAPILPDEVLDFHVHIWKNEDWKEIPWKTDEKGAKYMVSQEDYTVESLLRHSKVMFPDRLFNKVCFGNPTPAADPEKNNNSIADAGFHKGIYPLMIVGRDMFSTEELEKSITEKGFFGYKVFINWHGDDYGSVSIQDMIGEAEMWLADKLGLIVLLHVPRSDRLADPVVQNGVKELSEKYPGANIVLAHCGRAYHPDEMMKAIHSIRNLENVYLDTAMVMDPTVLQIVFKNIDSKRVLFATDLPIAAMRGRRVNVMDHWVDLVLEGYPESGYRVQSNNMRATFMVWEIVLAIKRASEMAGLTDEQMKAVFHDNGMALLRQVMNGSQLESAQARWARNT